MKILKKCKSYKTSVTPLVLTERTNWELFEFHMIPYYDLIESKSNKIQNITWNNTEILLQLKSNYFENKSFYVLFSTFGLTYKGKSK